MLPFIGGCSVHAPSEGERFEGETMGTTYVVRLAQTISETDRLGVARTIDDTLASVNRAMSNYLPDSEISIFNRAGTGTRVSVSREVFDVVSEARRVSELTGGAFDITVAPLVRLWGFGPGAYDRDEPPTEDEIARARAAVGFRHLVLADDPVTLTKLVPELECDLSAIAKGYGVDRVAEALEKSGYRDYMVEVGGEVRTLGKNSVGNAWRIAIEKPLPGARAIQRIVSLSGLSMATSGDYRNFYELEGKIYSHLIDPRTARPVSHRVASVSVLSDTAMEADALASGLLVLGPEEGFDLAVAQDLAVLFLSRTETGEIEERATPAFAELFPE
jgi:thiamine biosynthesis lipoprotein